MAAVLKTILTGQEKPEAVAAPVTSECAAIGAFNPGAGLPARSLPTNEASQSLALEPWAARHNEEIWGVWCIDATGHSYDEVSTDASIEIRTPRLDDIPGIVAVVADCAPYLTAHASYVYWRDVRLQGQKCAIAELGGEVVGWCSIFPAPAFPGTFFYISSASRPVGGAAEWLKRSSSISSTSCPGLKFWN
jgi:hypothetical protein